HALSPSPSRYSFSLLITRPPPPPTLFPYTTLFRSPTSWCNSASAGRERRPQPPSTSSSIARIAGSAPSGPTLTSTGRNQHPGREDRKSTRLNSSHDQISYAVFCLKKKIKNKNPLMA